MRYRRVIASTFTGSFLISSLRSSIGEVAPSAFHSMIPSCRRCARAWLARALRFSKSKPQSSQEASDTREIREELWLTIKNYGQVITLAPRFTCSWCSSFFWKKQSLKVSFSFSRHIMWIFFKHILVRCGRTLMSHTHVHVCSFTMMKINLQKWAWSLISHMGLIALLFHIYQPSLTSLLIQFSPTRHALHVTFAWVNPNC